MYSQFICEVVNFILAICNVKCKMSSKRGLRTLRNSIDSSLLVACFFYWFRYFVYEEEPQDDYTPPRPVKSQYSPAGKPPPSPTPTRKLSQQLAQEAVSKRGNLRGSTESIGSSRGSVKVMLSRDSSSCLFFIVELFIVNQLAAITDAK